MDDEEMNRNMLRTLLGRFGYDVVVASEGGKPLMPTKKQAYPPTRSMTSSWT